MKTSSLALAVVLLAAGCTTSTIKTRTEERYTAYTALAPEMRGAVDLGQVHPGMNMDAVYIAWGQPGQVLTGGDETGENVTWLYFGAYMRAQRNWGHRLIYYEYYPGTYVRAQVTFFSGLVRQWQTFGEPPY